MEKPPQATFLVLSDIHFGEFAYVPELACANALPKNIVRNAVHLIDSLIENVLGMAQKPTGILVPGDLTSIAAPSEFTGCVKTVNQIAERLSIDKKRVFFTFGNHDTNWRIAGLGKGVDGFSPDEAYETIAGQVGGLHAQNSEVNDPGPVIGSGVFIRDDCVLFLLNSGHACIEAQRYPHGQLGLEQLNWVDGMLKQHVNRNKWNIMVVHHHPFNYPFPTPVEDISNIQEGAELVDLAGKYGIDVICHGHRHHPKIFTEHKTAWAHPITFLCAGSVAVNEHHRMRGEIPNLFHILHLERRLDSGAAFGTVISYRYRSAEGWQYVSNDAKYTPIDPIQRFGVLSNELEFRRLIVETITKALNSTDGVSNLPEFETLPIELQCCAILKLNDTFKTEAKLQGLKFLGCYPEETFIKK